MRVLVTILAMILLWPAAASAKRKAPAPVPPVDWNGIEYRAPLDVDHMGCVQAFDLSSGRELWETKVYHVWFIPFAEEDTQWVFVSGLQVQDGKLLVRNEDGKTYWLDLMTGQVKGYWLSWLLVGFFVLAAGIFVKYWKSRGRNTVQ